MNSILTKILDAPEDSLDPLFECLNSVLNKTKSPIKYLVATSVLKLSESDQFKGVKLDGDNIIYILKVLQSNLKSLDASSGTVEDNFIMTAAALQDAAPSLSKKKD